MSARRVRVACHFGEWLQGRLGPEGPVALVTLMCRALGVEVCWQEGELAVRGEETILDECQLRRFLGLLEMPLEGRFHLRSDIRPGAGAGVSTAALVAVARASGAGDADAARVTNAAVCTEGATDPLMLADPDHHLWASRQGRSLREFGSVPDAEIAGGLFGPSLTTNPADVAFPDIADLVAPWAKAVELGDLRRVAELASESAARTTALRGPGDDPTAELARDIGALGWGRAHTGSARTLIFAPGSVPDTAMDALAEAGLVNPIRFLTGGAQ